MVAITLCAAPNARRPDVERHQLLDALWATAERGDRLEHVFAQVGSGRIDVVVFVMADNPHQAARAAERIHRRALLRSPVLSGWHITAVRGPDAR
ncbi:hypothetical protein ABZ721_37110 [Streptomyces sp. NPDC006733]|uniref:hypothetical protein n=1 Tax=Streptomyces sp. NPDC006733 TaxID=3155460 RepID=UPI0033BFF949